MGDRLSPVDADLHAGTVPLSPRASAVRKTLKGTVWLLGVCLFFEVAVRVLLSLLPPGALTRGEDNASWRLRWAERRRAGLGGYAFDVYHPTRGWALRGGLKGERVFGDKTLSSSAMGVRGSEERSYRKTQGSARILVFGDSFTFGEDVSDDETYPFFLERTLGGIEVLNCGVQGYGHDQMFLYLREEGLRYKPDVVLLGFVAQDME
ncbi:MAG TPA: SGNH/GDSL hydrolase family protein, partial [Vicinamibacteria bacterium]|nr:SGNH/GDSL hydrolase family protein [Vicinamibacteria bacterium]